MTWKEKDKKIRDILVKRLFCLREKGSELLREKEHQCKLKEANDVLSLVKAIDASLDAIRFTNYGYTDFEIKDYEIIEEKQREMFGILGEIEKDLGGDHKDPEVIPHIRKAKTMIESIKKYQEEIKSLIMAFAPVKKKEIQEEIP